MRGSNSMDQYFCPVGAAQSELAYSNPATAQPVLCHTMLHSVTREIRYISIRERWFDMLASRCTVSAYVATSGISEVILNSVTSMEIVIMSFSLPYSLKLRRKLYTAITFFSLCG